jgi:hypothetical protein
MAFGTRDHLRSLCGMLVAAGMASAASIARAQVASTVVPSPGAEPPPPPDRGSVDHSVTFVADDEWRGTPRFGDAGEFVVTTGFGAGISSSSWSNSDARSFGVSFTPSIEYFFVRDLSVGLEVDLSWSDGQGYGADGSLVETKHSLVSAAPHLGANIRFSRWLSLYSRLAFGVHRVEQSETLVSGQEISIAASPTGGDRIIRTGPWLSLDAPLVLQVAPRFFAGFGPSIYHDFSRAQGGPPVGAERTTFGASFMAGGFWGGTPAEEDAAGALAAVPKRRFGSKNTVVIMEESSLSVRWVEYTGVDSPQNSITISPGVDWFIEKNVSIGGALSYSKVEATGWEPSGTRVDANGHTLGASIRAGIAIPLAEWLSLYPRVFLGAGTGSLTQTAEPNFGSFPQRLVPATHRSSWDSSMVGVSAFALVHEDHFFVGLGPGLAYETRAYEAANSHNSNTRIGLGTIIGGWL